MDKMNGSSLGKQCQNPLPPPCPLPPPHLISTAYKDILWSSYLLVLNYMQATSAQAGQLSVKFFEIVHSIHCTTQNTRYWNLNSSMNVVSETDKTNQLSSLSHCHFIDASLISQCTLQHSFSLQNEHHQISAAAKTPTYNELRTRRPMW